MEALRNSELIALLQALPHDWHVYCQYDRGKIIVTSAIQDSVRGNTGRVIMLNGSPAAEYPATVQEPTG